MNKPQFPFKASSSYMTIGWDIPTCWSVDQNNNIFINDSHGSPPNIPVKLNDLLNDMLEEHDRIHVCKALGLPAPEPKWMALAKAAGYTLLGKMQTYLGTCT